ncbi:hypothetical protein PWT90_01600 [Aphanocladium album]|nr:hypothetical protein PWT90_01600 [Aphanocladium album]
MMRNMFSTVRRSLARPAPTAAATRLAGQTRYKTGKSGEEGQFKSVAASQSGHEPTEKKTSKPPHKASRPDVKRQIPAQLEPENVDPSEKKNTTDRS